MAAGSLPQVSSSTRIAFFTYGFFRAVSKTDATLSRWGAVILDEAHERNIDAELLLPMMGMAARARPEFKAIVMSATIDVRVFAQKLTDCINGSSSASDPVAPPAAPSYGTYESNFADDGYAGTDKCPVLKVTGASFPVETIWWSGSTPWDPTCAGALDSLCVEVLRLFNHETGNILVFLSSTQDVVRSVAILSGKLTHDPDVDVLPLYATLSGPERAKVERFTDEQLNPQNEGRRFVCFSTNVAEAGVTIPGITAVVDTGREIVVAYDIELKADLVKVQWISQASALQRRGRAGRISPGRCYPLYTEADFKDNMSEFSTPTILKKNCDSLYLDLLTSNFLPDDFIKYLVDDQSAEVMDAARDRMDAARDSLLNLKAIVVDDLGRESVTRLGKLLNRLPLELPLAKCVAVAAQFGCGEQLAVIACMQANNVQGKLFTGTRAEQAAARDAFRELSGRTLSGDHEVMLNVFDQWVDNKKSPSWCRKNNLDPTLLGLADVQLRKVYKACDDLKLELGSLPASLSRSALIVDALCLGLADNIAVATDPGNVAAGLRLVRGYSASPTIVKHHFTSVIGEKEAVKMLVYHKLSVAKDGTHLISGVTSVNESQVQKAGRARFSGSQLDNFKAQLKSMNNEVTEIAMKPVSSHEAAAVELNLKDVRRDYPLASIKSSQTKTGGLTALTVRVACAPVQTSTIRQAVQDAFDSAVDQSCDVTGVPDISKWVQSDGKNSLTQAALRLRDDLRKDLSLDRIQFKGDLSACTIQVTAVGAYLADVSRRVRLKLGLSAGPGPLPAAKGAEDPQTLRRLSALDRSRTAKSIIAEFGGGRGGSMLALAHYLVWNTGCWIYGGFIRDYIMTGDDHVAMDLDVGLPKHGGLSLTTATSAVQSWPSNPGLKMVGRPPCGPNVLSLAFTCADGATQMEVQFVDTVFWAQKDPLVDFDVNNLKLDLDQAKGKVKLSLKYPDQDKSGAGIDGICANIRARVCHVMKPLVGMVPGRVTKMQSRNWHVVLQP